MLSSKKLNYKKYVMYLLLFITGYFAASIINTKEYMNNDDNGNGNGNGDIPESKISVWIFIFLGLCAALILWGLWDRRNGNI